MYDNLGHLITSLTSVFDPPERLTVTEANEKYRRIDNPGAYSGPYCVDKSPYMREIQDTAASREFNAMAVVAPAQSAKTEMFISWLTYSIMCDPLDMILYQTTKDTGRDFSIRRIDRMHRTNKNIAAKLLPGGSNDNVFDKRYSNMLLNISWPSINEMSGKPIPRTFLTDYDRMPQDVDGEGSPFDLARKRTTTFGSNGMTVAESSPGFEVEDPAFQRQTDHQAPPCKGILSLYNRGDRRRWYWKCINCGEWFEPSFSLLWFPRSKDHMESAEAAEMTCPHCAETMTADKKYELNKNGIWLKDGEKINKFNMITGKPIRSDIASFWLKGPAAAFQSWKNLVLNYLKAEEEFQLTNSQEALKTTVNVDQGEAYIRRGNERGRLPDELKAKAVDIGDRVVPENVRFLIATGDVQKNKFVCQVYGVSPAPRSFDLWQIDRIEIEKSHRLDDDNEHLWVNPSVYKEDWYLLIEKVLAKRYRLCDNSGDMMIKMMVCDSGGKAGVTSRAYDFWKELREEGNGEHKRFYLCKGNPKMAAPRAEVSYPDAEIKGRTASARGEIPVLMLNSNLLKDTLNAMLDRNKEGGNAFFISKVMPDNVFTELTVEIKGEKGWENPRKARNEAWDLTYYAIGLCHYLKVMHFDWDRPPSWAAEWANNDLVLPIDASDGKFAETKKASYDLQKLGDLLS